MQHELGAPPVVPAPIFGPGGRALLARLQSSSRSPAGSCSSRWSRCRSFRSSDASSSRGRFPATSRCCRCARPSRRRRSSPSATSSTATSRSTSSPTACGRASSRRSTPSGRCWSASSARCIAWRTAAGAVVGVGGRRDVGDARLAGVDRAGADGAGIRAARGCRLLHERAAIAHCHDDAMSAALPSRPCALPSAPRSGAVAALGNTAHACGPDSDGDRSRLRHLRRDADADGRARADRHRDVHRRLRRLSLSHRRQSRRAAQFAQESRVRAAVELRPRRHSAVPADGAVRDARRTVEGAVPLRQRVPRPLAGRRRDGGDRRVRGIRRDLRLLGRHGGDDGAGGAAGAAPLRLLRLARRPARSRPAARSAS